MESKVFFVFSQTEAVHEKRPALNTLFYIKGQPGAFKKDRENNLLYKDG